MEFVLKYLVRKINKKFKNNNANNHAQLLFTTRYICMFPLILKINSNCFVYYILNDNSPHYQGADKSLARPASLSIVFSVQGTGGSPTGPDPENRMSVQDIGNAGRPVSSGLQVPGEPFSSWSG
jgi:hypothetical protein